MRHRVLAAFAGAIAISLVAGPASAEPTPGERARYGARYLVQAQNEDGSWPGFSTIGSTADAVVSLVTARRAPGAIDDALGYLRASVDDADLGQKAKIVMAAVAAGADPQDFGGVNLVQDIQGALQGDGQYADPAVDNAEVTYQALAILGLRAADAAVPRRALEWLADAQCGDGGWQFDDPASELEDEHCRLDSSDWAGSDTNTTALAVQAWNARTSTVALENDPFAFFRSARDPIKRGWVYDPSGKCTTELEGGFCYRTDANSTAAVIQAYVSEGLDVPRRGLVALAELQYNKCRGGGSFAFTWVVEGDRLARSPEAGAGGATVVGATVAAIQGLLQQPLPAPAREVLGPPPLWGCPGGSVS